MEIIALFFIGVIIAAVFLMQRSLNSNVYSGRGHGTHTPVSGDGAKRWVIGKVYSGDYKNGQTSYKG